jgi:Omp85 superfamily domain
LIRIAAILGVILFCESLAVAQESSADTRPGIAPDIREDETKLKVQRGNFVVVPIPISNPTLDSGLVAGGAYFYPQTEEQKKLQPASVTALGGLYTSNDSRAFVIAQQNYWKNDRWRFTGAIGGADLRLSLLAPDETGDGSSVDWRINGQFLFAKLSRRLKGDWYGGVLTRVVDANQSINTETENADAEFDLGDVTSVGLGAVLEYDSRDNPFNSSSGRHFKVDALFNDESIGSDATYQSYSGAFRSYHRLSDSVILAWEVQGCKRGGTAPLWDACTIKLRGFSVTDYLGKVSTSGQVEARWQMSERWGVVGFAGSGYFGGSFNDLRSREAIPSYGAGLRFMVLKAKGINLRLDYARSTDSDAIHVSVGEAF